MVGMRGLVLLSLLGLSGASSSSSSSEEKRYEPEQDRILDMDVSAPEPGSLEEPEGLGPGGSDALLNPEQEEEAFRSGNAKANADLWTTNGQPIVPYVINPVFYQADMAKHLQQIRAAMKDYHNYTCIKWVDNSRLNSPQYVEFISDRGCYSYVGRQPTAYYDPGQGQPISLGPGCERAKGTTIHEMMHTLGFFHEQSRPDRDSHIRVNYDNIRSDRFIQFEKQSENEVLDEGTLFDAKSLMLYGSTSFSKNGENTIDFVDPDFTAAERQKLQSELGQRYGFAASDVIEINNLYKCPASYNDRLRELMRKTDGKDCRDEPPTNEDGSYCGRMKASGLCGDPLNFEKFCRMTCEYCKAETTGSVTAPPCVDLQKSCGSWLSTYGRYLCSSNAYVKQNCQKSCGFCAAPVCADVPGGVPGIRDGTLSCPKVVETYGTWPCDRALATSTNIRSDTRHLVQVYQGRCPKTCGFC